MCQCRFLSRYVSTSKGIVAAEDEIMKIVGKMLFLRRFTYILYYSILSHVTVSQVLKVGLQSPLESTFIGRRQ
jgi:hypothetical protein